MYTDGDEHAPEGEMVPAPNHQVLQAVIIEHTVIDPFAGSPFYKDSYIASNPLGAGDGNAGRHGF